ncbi:stimulated by retinoic acid gene 6 protein-like [Amphiura filiformis]|uniref:stimulated by retinoic acid gene 6 protein-like n=1 Tax=Amphiura filiformis TaxID=82378 RepID=UPI003B21DB07
MCKAKTMSATLHIAPPRDFRKTHYYDRVTYLLTPPIHQKQTFRSKVRALFYQSKPGFKYSRRFVVTIAVSALALYEVSLAYMFGIDYIFSTLIHVFAYDGPLEKGFEVTNNTETFGIIHRALNSGKDTFWITCYVSLGIMVSFIIHMIVVYRDNTMRLWKGDRSFYPPEELSFATLVVANLRYSGYQIAYCIWGTQDNIRNFFHSQPILGPFWSLSRC